MSLNISPITPNFGAKITGIDLKKAVADDVRHQLQKTLSEYAVLVFPKQFLEPEDIVRSGEIFGSLMPQQLKKYILPDFPMVGYNTTKDLPL